MRPMYSLVVDLDDVLFPFCEVAQDICERAGITNGGTITQWQMHDDYGVSREALWGVLDDATITGELYGASPIPGALAPLARLRGYGHRVHLITARGVGKHGAFVEAQTREWVRDWGVPFDSLTFSNDKTEIRSDFALDDKPEHCEALTRSGSMAFLMNAVHNQHHQDHHRVQSVDEFASNVLAFADAGVQVRGSN